MSDLTKIVVEVAKDLRGCLFPEFLDMPIRYSWGYSSWFRWKAGVGIRRITCPKSDLMKYAQIRFGYKCVEWNAKNPSKGRLYKELIKMGLSDYFGHSSAVILAALICHEFAHACNFLQGIKCGHDDMFYREFRRLMEGWGETLALDIAEIGGNDLLEEHEQVQQAALREPPKTRISRWDNVSFPCENTILRGIVTESRGRGRVRVAVGSGDQIEYFKVPRNLLTKIS